MRPLTKGPAHHTGDFAELVCSNSLKNEDPNTAAGLLKHELTTLGSVVLEVARRERGSRGLGARRRQSAILGRAHPPSERAPAHHASDARRRQASPPAASSSQPGRSRARRSSPSLLELVGDARMAFFDAAAPIVDAESLNRDVVFAASRYDKGEGADYLNAPWTATSTRRFTPRSSRPGASTAQGVRAARAVRGVPAGGGGRPNGRRRAALRRAQAGRPHRSADRRAPVGGRAAARREPRSRPPTTSSASRRT